MNEEKYITEKFGQDNPFRVPDGYFDQLSAQVMSKLPERKQKARFVSLRPILYAAASIVLVLVMGVAYFFQQDNNEQTLATNNTTTTTTYESSYIDEAADYAMLDNVEIYACLSDN